MVCCVLGFLSCSALTVFLEVSDYLLVCVCVWGGGGGVGVRGRGKGVHCGACL